MTVQINSNYLEKYAKDYAAKASDQYFSSRQYMTGQDIVQLTNSTQVNFFIIKGLFELWQVELEKLKSNPYFDYRDITVHESLTQFMNVLSRRIKIEREHLEPLLEKAVQQSVTLATDPVSFYQKEIESAPENQINNYLKENKKYYKWHSQAILFLVDKAGFGHDQSAYLRAIAANYQAIKDSLESVNLLLATLGDIKPFDLDSYLVKNETTISNEISHPEIQVEDSNSSFFDQVDQDLPSVRTPEPTRQPNPKPVVEEQVQPVIANGGGTLDVAMLKAKFETLSYKGMKGVNGELVDNVAINQRFMFTKELFDGNADLLRHALKSIDKCNSFEQAIGLINARFAHELGWAEQSEPVHEFLQLIYRKFES
jgi:hypothetical protein